VKIEWKDYRQPPPDDGPSIRIVVVMNVDDEPSTTVLGSLKKIFKNLFRSSKGSGGVPHGQNCFQQERQGRVREFFAQFLPSL
jgi:hypothetical protein